MITTFDSVGEKEFVDETVAFGTEMVTYMVKSKLRQAVLRLAGGALQLPLRPNARRRHDDRVEHDGAREDGGVRT